MENTSKYFKKGDNVTMGGNSKGIVTRSGKDYVDVLWSNGLEMRQWDFMETLKKN